MLVLDDVQNYSLTQTAGPIREPISTSEAMRHLRLDGVVDVDSLDTQNSTDFTNTTNPLTVTNAVTNYGLITFVSGLLIKIGSEIMEVTEVSDNDVTFERGVFGTPIISHTDVSGNSNKVFISTPNEDDIRQMVVTAREYAEEYQWSALMTQTWALRLDRFPPGVIRIPKQPLATINAVTYVDSAGDSQTLVVGTDYSADLVSQPGRIFPAFDKSWPVTRGFFNDVSIGFVAGYGTGVPAGSTVPQRIKHAIKLMVADWYWNRGPVGDLTGRVKTTVNALLDYDNFSGVIG